MPTEDQNDRAEILAEAFNQATIQRGRKIAERFILNVITPFLRDQNKGMCCEFHARLLMCGMAEELLALGGQIGTSSGMPATFAMSALLGAIAQVEEAEAAKDEEAANSNEPAPDDMPTPPSGCVH